MSEHEDDTIYCDCCDTMLKQGEQLYTCPVCLMNGVCASCIGFAVCHAGDQPPDDYDEESSR